MIRVLLVTRSPALRASLETVVRSTVSLEFAGSIEFEHFSSSGFRWSDLTGDVILAEIDHSPDQDWKALTELPLPVLALLDPADSALVRAVLRAGFRGIIFSDSSALEVESAMQAVNAGLFVSASSVLSELLPDTPSIIDELPESLSDRERKVLELLAEGLSNKLVAQALSISEHTVKTHVASIFAKLGVSSRTEAVSQAVRRGLVML